MLNLISLNHICCHHSKNGYDLISLGFKNHTLYYITYECKPIYKYISYKSALKRFFSLVDIYGGS